MLKWCFLRETVTVHPDCLLLNTVSAHQVFGCLLFLFNFFPVFQACYYTMSGGKEISIFLIIFFLKLLGCSYKWNVGKNGLSIVWHNWISPTKAVNIKRSSFHVLFHLNFIYLLKKMLCCKRFWPKFWAKRIKNICIASVINKGYLHTLKDRHKQN